MEKKAVDKKELIGFDLYLITDRKIAADRGLLHVVEEALEGGIKAVQLREKDLDGRELLRVAAALRELTERYGALLFINDRVDVALLCGADGVHLPEDSFSPSALRERFGRRLLIGVSCHSVEAVKRAEREGADFATLGPVYDTPSKRMFGPPVGTAPLKEASRTGLPVFALGGIRKENMREVIKCGVHGVAVISAILGAPAIREETEKLICEIRKNKKEVIL